MPTQKTYLYTTLSEGIDKEASIDKEAIIASATAAAFTAMMLWSAYDAYKSGKSAIRNFSQGNSKQAWRDVGWTAIDLVGTATGSGWALKSLGKATKLAAHASRLLKAGKVAQAVPILRRATKLRKGILAARIPKLKEMAVIAKKSGKMDDYAKYMTDLAGLQKGNEAVIAAGEAIKFTTGKSNRVAKSLLKTIESSNKAHTAQLARQSRPLYKNTIGKVAPIYKNVKGGLDATVGETGRKAADLFNIVNMAPAMGAAWVAPGKSLAKVNKIVQKGIKSKYGKTVTEMDKLKYVAPIIALEFGVAGKTLGKRYSDRVQDIDFNSQNKYKQALWSARKASRVI